MDLFKSNLDKVEEEILKQQEKDKKRSREVDMGKHYKRYGTKKQQKRPSKHDILTSWRDDI